MAETRHRRSDILFYIVIMYILVAGSWWSYLLQIKNNDALESKKSVLWHELKAKEYSEEEYLSSPQLQTLIKEYNRQKWMIMGEGAVLLVIMIFGISRIYKSRQKELEVARQQRNFLLSITHELKSPIASVQLTLETLQRRQLPEEITKKLTTGALKDTHRLHKLVQDLLLAARMESGYQYVMEPLSLRQVILQCIQLASPKYSGEIKLEMDEKADASDFLVQGDPTTLTSVVLNLLENAVKYAATTPLINVRLFRQKDKAVVEIQDTGPGIPKNEKPKIFDKFYRLGNEETRNSKGTGLGLYIVKKVTEDHNGQITVRDNQPQGSVFSLILPLVS